MALGRERLANEPVHGVLVAHVNCAHGALAASSAAELLCLEQLVADDVAGPDARAARGECEADRAPEAVRGAGHDRCLSTEVRVHS